MGFRAFCVHLRVQASLFFSLTQFCVKKMHENMRLFFPCPAAWLSTLFWAEKSCGSSCDAVQMVKVAPKSHKSSVPRRKSSPRHIHHYTKSNFIFCFPCVLSALVCMLFLSLWQTGECPSEFITQVKSLLGSPVTRPSMLGLPS